MSRLNIASQTKTEAVLDDLYATVLRRMSAGTAVLCPVDMAAAFLRLCHAQSCGKCVPCRVGLGQLGNLLEDVLSGRATMETLELIEKTASAIYATADCAIGHGSAALVLRGLEGFREDYISHIQEGKCSVKCEQGVPCISKCPAGVEIPGYVALVAEGRYADAVRLIRKDNPFPAACGYVCEQPCEAKCRRRIVDDAINIRGLKRFAVDNAGVVPPTEVKYPATGKRVAVVGGGPAGLTAAYFLTIMGHSVEVFEKSHKLGGMLRYGIPRYRLPGEKLDEDINAILATGVKVHYGFEVGKDATLVELKEKFDAVFISIGAHTYKKLKIEGEEGEGVISAIKLLRDIEDGNKPDFTGKTVTVVGGGNVAMDAARSALRCGAKVNIVYRRRQQDMTALPEEIHGTIAEGCNLITLCAPVRIERGEDGAVKALIIQPQISGKLDKSGRPTPVNAKEPERRIETDIVIAAIGQAIDSDHFGQSSIPLDRDTIMADDASRIYENPGVYAGGDCVTGPATVIRAIAGGKVAAANIDVYLGYHHVISEDIDVPDKQVRNIVPCGRQNMVERVSDQRVCDFCDVELPLAEEEAQIEATRCLRCDHFGYGPYWADRRHKW